jgi:predicted transcriptional regulator
LKQLKITTKSPRFKNVIANNPTITLLEKLLHKRGATTVLDLSVEMNMSYSGVKTALQRMILLDIVEVIRRGGEAPSRGGPAPDTYQIRVKKNK